MTVRNDGGAVFTAVLFMTSTGSAARQSSAMISVLVVDDDFMVAKVHGGFVRPHARVRGGRRGAHRARRSLETAERAAARTWCCWTSTCPTSGLELMRRLREVAPELDVLVISAAKEAETVRRALRGGVVNYLLKPFSQTDLQERLEHYRNTYQSLASSKDVAEQADVNRVFGLERGTGPLPKGCSAETLQVVEQGAAEAEGDVSAAELAALVGASRVSARRYLEYLNDEGLVDIDAEVGVGRPERRAAPGGLS